MTRLAILAFLATLGLSWPDLPLNIRLPDLLFLPLLILLLSDGRARPAFVPLDVLVAAYLAGSVPSLLVTADLRSSLIELVRHVYVVAIYGTVALAVLRGHLRTVMTGIAVSGVSLAIVGVVFAASYMFRPSLMQAIGETMPLPYLGTILRLRALTLSPAMLVCVLMMAAPFVIIGAIRARASLARRLWVGALVFVVLAAVLTFSHALGGFLVAALIAAWPALSGRPGWRRAAAVAAALFAVLCNLTTVASIRQVALSSSEPVIADRTAYVYAIDEGRVQVGPVHVVYETMSYFRLKQLAWDAFRARPLTGVGLDQFHEVTERGFQAGRMTEHYRAVDPHSSMFGRLAETGLPGGLTLALLWAGVMVIGMRAIRHGEAWPARAAFAGLVGLLIAGINVDIMNFRFFWAGLGVLRACASVRAPDGAD